MRHAGGKLTKRQAELVALLRANGGRMPYQSVAHFMYPEDRYPRAFQYSSNGGPPGCYMALSAMIRRMRLGVSANGIGKCRTDIYLTAEYRGEPQ